MLRARESCCYTLRALVNPSPSVPPGVLKVSSQVPALHALLGFLLFLNHSVATCVLRPRDLPYLTDVATRPQPTCPRHHHLTAF